MDSLVLSYEGGRVFASATPHSLKIWAEAELGKHNHINDAFFLCSR